jgi:hypothetical protein
MPDTDSLVKLRQTLLDLIKAIERYSERMPSWPKLTRATSPGHDNLSFVVMWNEFNKFEARVADVDEWDASCLSTIDEIVVIGRLRTFASTMPPKNLRLKPSENEAAERLSSPNIIQFLKSNLARLEPPEAPHTSGNIASDSTVATAVNQVLPTSETKLKEPSEKARQCYRLMFTKEDEWTQAKIAKEVYGDSGKQSKVSRDIKQVKTYVEAGGVLPDLTTQRPKTHAVDPSQLDKGPRIDRGRK